jgi:DNA-binding NarL/FixJ family response regulator
MAGKISVVVIDDHSLFRAGVIQTLELDPGIEVVGEGGTGEKAIELAERLRPDIILLDISMPGNGIEAAGKIAARPDAPRVIMLTVSEDDDSVIAALEAGAVGYILKGIESLQLITAVKSVAAGDSFVSPNLTVRLLSGVRNKLTPGMLDRLSDQEKRILRLVAQGLSNREVGEKIGVLEKTIKFHMTRIMAKLDVRNRVEASLLAQKEWEQDVSHKSGK